MSDHDGDRGPGCGLILGIAVSLAIWVAIGAAILITRT